LKINRKNEDAVTLQMYTISCNSIILKGSLMQHVMRFVICNLLLLNQTLQMDHGHIYFKRHDINNITKNIYMENILKVNCVEADFPCI